jgi:hypothetical protein
LSFNLLKYNLLKANIFLIAALHLFFVACNPSDDSNDDNNNSSSNSADLTSEIMEQGDWQITRFEDSGVDQTNDFNGYTFVFNTDGTVVASNGNQTVNGTWNIMDDSSNSSSDDDGNSSDDDDFILDFAVPESSDFEDLIDDWDFISVDNTKIELRDISGGNGGTDYLTFERL